MIFKLCTKERGLLLLDDAISIFILLDAMPGQEEEEVCVVYTPEKKSKSSVEKMREINDE